MTSHAMSAVVCNRSVLGGLLAKTLAKRAPHGRGVNAQAFSLLQALSSTPKVSHLVFVRGIYELSSHGYFTKNEVQSKLGKCMRFSCCILVCSLKSIYLFAKKWYRWGSYLQTANMDLMWEN